MSAVKDLQIIVGNIIYHPWTPTGPNAEATFVNAAMAHSGKLLPGFHVFPLEQKIVSNAGVGVIPDAIAVDVIKKQWGLVEFELKSHPEYSHIQIQLAKILSAIKSNYQTRLSILDSLYEQVKKRTEICEQVKIDANTNDIHKALDFILRVEPFILVVVDQITSRLEEALETVKGDMRVAEVVLYIPEGDHVPENNLVLHISVKKQEEYQQPSQIKAIIKTDISEISSPVSVDLSAFEGVLKGWKKEVFNSMRHLAQQCEPKAILAVKGPRRSPYVAFKLEGYTFMRVRHTLQTYFYPDFKKSGFRINEEPESVGFLANIRAELPGAIERLRRARRI